MEKNNYNIRAYKMELSVVVQGHPRYIQYIYVCVITKVTACD